MKSACEQVFQIIYEVVKYIYIYRERERERCKTFENESQEDLAVVVVVARGGFRLAGLWFLHNKVCR
jgi:hypothetical protein